MDVKTTYLQMFAHPQRIVPPPRDGLVVVHARKPSVAYYRFLYDAVGRDYDWTSRKKLSDVELTALLHDPRLELYVLMADGVPAGFAECDRRIEGEIELVQFGLMPEFIGQGLGRYFLQWTIDKAWAYNPRRFWLHTCTKDHPAALPNYLKAGFAIYKEGLDEDDREARPRSCQAEQRMLDEKGLRLRIVLEKPPAGVDFGLQEGKGHDYKTVTKQRSKGKDLSFDCTVLVRDNREDGLPNFLGPMTHGPPTDRFLYIDIGQFAGQKDSPWNRRLKIPLGTITWQLIEQAMVGTPSVLEARIPGTEKGGGPSCGTASPADGWRLVRVKGV